MQYSRIYFIFQNLAITFFVCLIYKVIVYLLRQYVNAFEQLIRVQRARELAIEK